MLWGDAAAPFAAVAGAARAGVKRARRWALATAAAHVGSRRPLEQPLPVALPEPIWCDVAVLASRALAAVRAALRSTAVRAWLVVAAFTLAGLGVRLLVTRGIWVDEAFSVHQAQLPFHEMLDSLQRTDRHPPLHYAVLWLVVHVFGSDNELVVRAPSIVAGALLVPVLFLCGRELHDRRTGLVAAALGAVAPLVVWYSQEARMYSFYMLFAAVALWAQVCVIRRGKIRHWIVYTLATIGLLWTHYFAILYVGVQQLVLAAVAWRRAHRREPLRALIVGSWLSSLAIVLAVLPLVSFAQHQLVVSQAANEGFSSVPTQAAPDASGTHNPSVYALLSNVLWAIWGYHSDATMLQLAALWPLAMLLALALLGRGRSGNTLLLLALAFVPMMLLFAAGFAERDLFEVRYFAGGVPALLLLAARGATVCSPHPRTVAAVAGLLVATVLGALADQQLNSRNPRMYDFRGALQQIDDRARSGDVVLYSPAFLRDVIEYYPLRVPTRPLLTREPRPAAVGRVFLLASFLDAPKVASQSGSAVYHLERERGLVGRIDDGKIRIWIFGRKRGHA